MQTIQLHLPQRPNDANNNDYRFLPFRFRRLMSGNILLTNVSGEYLVLPQDTFFDYTRKRLPTNSEAYKALKATGFLTDSGSAHLEQLSSRFWTKKSFLCGFTKLHIFVLTLRCNCSCTYCQVTRQNEDTAGDYDMDEERARKSVELMMQSPSPQVTVEFQGGEPLLNFKVLKEIVLYSEKLNETKKKSISYVVCTNLSLLTEEMLDFFEEHKVNISTSIDGPASLHNSNRCRKIFSATHDIVTKNIKLAQERLGMESVSALMTTTRDSLTQPEAIIDEYVRLGFRSIFIRALNPYGYAIKTQKAIGYSTDEFVSFYKRALNYLIEINKKGTYFSEAFATLLFRKILTPWPVGFVDLQSPTGNGFAVTVYNYDGDVYASDESRMLYEMGDPKFRLGSALNDTYKEIYFGEAMQTLASTGVAECLAGCSECAFVPYCGADPVRHYATQHDAYGNRANSDFCRKNTKIFEYLFDILEKNDPKTQDIIWSWLREAPIEAIEIKEEQ